LNDRILGLSACLFNDLVDVVSYSRQMLADDHNVAVAVQFLRVAVLSNTLRHVIANKMVDSWIRLIKHLF
jgi:hypothetical protein